MNVVRVISPNTMSSLVSPSPSGRRCRKADEGISKSLKLPINQLSQLNNERATYFNNLGYEILKFWNNEVRQHFNLVNELFDPLIRLSAPSP
ncbi:hypothetical protein Lmor_2504 [Legionella moravica]|uniref:DUF559 domain-containing protein n=2 Tax=Legionella moravica TaxID=39962 RepID=A0A378JXS5_9GAMM|nr:hypothetical protein Lmor_2504 [Legionella moravica]STX62292.1 Uncharacterised protein [Legionella moravica]STX62293.1 Uncharacterised protein [Legionella moravica]